MKKKTKRIIIIILIGIGLIAGIRSVIKNMTPAIGILEIDAPILSSLDYLETIREYEEEGVSDDSRVWVIMSYIDNANTLVILAEDKFKMSDYSSAINYAGQAESKAEMAYECAVGLNNELDIASPAMKVTSASTQYSVTSSSTSGSVADLDEIIPDIGNNEEIGDIDDLLHSEVDIESTLKILGLVADALMGAFDFLSDLISMASDN